ncbi:MAG: hypothetical protein FJ096_17055, partial [Deltaproteobacteria bacterium]|nr:hypothetical protein [Deltaproteobacteria bacterium]
MAESLQPGEGGAAHDVEPQEPVRPLPEVGAALRILGLLAIVASVLVQAVELAVVGVWTGIDDLVNLLRLLGAASSQCFAVAGVIVAVLLARTLARAGPRDAVRAMSVSALLIVTVSVLIASGALSELLRRALGERLLTRLPVESGLVLSGTVALFASVVGAKRVSEPHYRGGAIIVLGCATAACGHLVQSAALAFGSTDAGRSEVLPAVFATVEWTALGGAAVFALA